jgi:hypothetical protein
MLPSTSTFQAVDINTFRSFATAARRRTLKHGAARAPPSLAFLHLSIRIGVLLFACAVLCTLSSFRERQANRYDHPYGSRAIPRVDQ